MSNVVIRWVRPTICGVNCQTKMQFKHFANYYSIFCLIIIAFQLKQIANLFSRLIKCKFTFAVSFANKFNFNFNFEFSAIIKVTSVYILKNSIPPYCGRQNCFWMCVCALCDDIAYSNVFESLWSCRSCTIEKLHQSAVYVCVRARVRICLYKVSPKK